MERKESSTSKETLIGAELAIFKGVICERAEIFGAVLAPLNSNVASVFFKLALHMVQFRPYNWVDLAQKLVPKTAPFQWGRIDPKPVPNWTHSFGPIFWAKSTLFILQCVFHVKKLQQLHLQIQPFVNMRETI